MHRVAKDGTAAAVAQADADSCCAAAERHDGSQPSGTTVAAPTLTPLLDLFTEPPPVSAQWVDQHRPPPLLATRQLPTHLLHSVFLI